VFYGEDDIFPAPYKGTCFDATPENMVNQTGDDVSAWLGGTHAFEYTPATGIVTLNGLGAWIGLYRNATDATQITVPQQSTSFKINITEHSGYDLMEVWFIYDDYLWKINYVSYSDASLEPALVTSWGEVLPKITPTEMYITFAADHASEKATIDVVFPSGSTVVFGVEDPLDATATKVGKFTRTAGVHYQELHFRTAPEPKDIQFDNFTTAKIDIYIPADTDFTTLRRTIEFGIADQSATEQWWIDFILFSLYNSDVVLGAWTTYTFNLTNVKARKDLDMIFLQNGSGGHNAGGTFYIRNLIFE
jgi:hypothetical protein